MSDTVIVYCQEDDPTYVNMKVVSNDGSSCSAGISTFHNHVDYDLANYILNCIAAILYNLDRSLLPTHFFENIRMKSDAVVISGLKCRKYEKYERYQEVVFSSIFISENIFGKREDKHTKVSFLIKPVNSSSIINGHMINDIDKDVEKKIIEVIVNAYYNILLNSCRHYFYNKSDLSKFLCNYPIIINPRYESVTGSTIFDKIFTSDLTFEKKKELYNILTKKLRIIPFGTNLLVNVCCSERITEATEEILSRKYYRPPYTKNDKGYYYYDIIDELIANGYSMSIFSTSVLPIHVVMKECDIDYIKSFIEKYGTAELNTPTIKYGYSPIMMLIGCCSHRVYDDNEICEIIKYLYSLGVINFSARDNSGKTVFDHCKVEWYPKSKELLKNIMGI